MSARTADRDVLSHGEELISGLLARQVALLEHVRTLLVLLIVLPVVGGLIALIALSSSTSPIGSFFNG